MSERPVDDESFVQAFPSPEQQAPYVGKVVAYDIRTGEIRDSADTFEDLAVRFTDQALESLSLLYIPGYRFIG